MTAPSHEIVMQGNASYLSAVKQLLLDNGLDAELVQPPGAKTNG